MTRVLAVDANNDIFIARNGRLSVVAGLPAIMQACEHAAKAQLGEMMFAVNRGIPNFETIWRGAANIGQFDSALRNALLRVPGVTRVTGFTADQAGDVLQYAVTISTVEGEAVINGSI